MEIGVKWRQKNGVRKMKWLDRWFRKIEEEEKPVLYCVHGFGVRRTVEFARLVDYFQPLGYTVVTPELFDQTDETDVDASRWIKRAEDGLVKLLDQEKTVWLLGYSMGGVIASKLASLYPVERLVLLAPAFDYLSIKVVMDKVEGVARAIIRQPEKNKSEFPPFPESFSNVFRDVVALCKESISQVLCPILILHGSSDQTIPVRSSEWAYARINHQDKLLLIIEGAPHRMLDEAGLNQDILKIIHDFFKKEIIKESTRR
ncbi:MAG TPA: hypothetical protein DCP62_10875 [Erysipelotrichaceae bacterium]|nr:hypothetical protein [Erysipelotrichaceae bacterium]